MWDELWEEGGRPCSKNERTFRTPPFRGSGVPSGGADALARSTHTQGPGVRAAELWTQVHRRAFSLSMRSTRVGTRFPARIRS